jgi:hypothetical protein
VLMNITFQCGRRPKGDNFEAPLPFPGEEEELEEVLEEEEVDEEIDFDNPSFKRDQIWSDYAEDLDYDQ